MHSDNVPHAAYDIGGRRWAKDEPGFAEAIASAFVQRLRPRCLCRRNPDGLGIEMYVARIMDGYIVKRMPSTGSQHATSCPSYEPPADFSGLGSLLGSAIVENPITGKTTLKLDFSMTKLPGRATLPSAASAASAASANSSVSSQGQKLSLRALLHYLWDQAQLTHWHPGFAERRNWATVRRHLLRAAENKFTHGHSLLDSLYIPEMFFVDQREVIRARCKRRWAHAAAAPDQPQRLMVIIAEVKEIVPTRFGYKVVVKHVPDQAFGLDEPMFGRLGRHFAQELALWSANNDIRLIIIATFTFDLAGTPRLAELSPMPVNSQWLPVEDHWERDLLAALVENGRSFVKGLRYNVIRQQNMVSASLLDSGTEPSLLHIDRCVGCNEDHTDDRDANASLPQSSDWCWHANKGPMPPLPQQRCVSPTLVSLQAGT